MLMLLCQNIVVLLMTTCSATDESMSRHRGHAADSYGGFIIVQVSTSQTQAFDIWKNAPLAASTDWNCLIQLKY